MEALVSVISTRFARVTLLLTGTVVLLAAGGLHTAVPNVDHNFAWSHPLKKAGQVVASWSAPTLHCLDWDGVVFDSGGTA